MIFLSPGVFVQEKDISDIIPRVATASAALVGYSAKGSVDNIMLITSDQQFLAEYGQPDPSTGHYFHYAALAYLEQGNTLYCLRVANGALRGGVDIMDSVFHGDNRTATVGKSDATFDAPSGDENDVLFQIMGTNPGVWNNKIGIMITEIKDGSDIIPTDQYTFKIVVYLQNADGAWELVETWKVSRKNKLDGYGKQMYLENKINGASKYIIVVDNTSSYMIDTKLPQSQAERLDFTKGDDGSEISSSELILGWDQFKDPENVDVRILINGGETAKAVQTEMKVIAESRADCIAVLDMPYTELTSVTSMVNWRLGVDTHNFNSSYCALYAGWVQIYDPYNDMLIDVPPSGHVAAKIAYNDYVKNPWDAPAGYSRGMLNVIKPSNIFSEGERDTLYEAQINPIQMFRGEGIAIWGQKTEQTKSSALSRINVRRLLIVIEKSIAIALRSFVFEPNSEITRFRVEAMLNDWLDRLSAQGAFQLEGGDKGYHVVCDETNNLPATIDDNELHVDVFIKPVRSAEYIRLQTIITSTGASFNELISQGVMF
jgi:phage tail sheath protein FI